MWDASDEALLAGLGTGDSTASVAFVRRFQRRVYGLALVVLRDEGRAEEVAQEAFVRAWRHASTYDPRRASVATWLLAITRNLAIDRSRVERARPVELFQHLDVIDLRRLDVAPEPAEMAVRGDEVSRVTAALRRLPVEQQRALVLAALYGRTAREISDGEGIPLGTAKTRIRTAVLRLRDEFGTPATEPEARS